MNISGRYRGRIACLRQANNGKSSLLHNTTLSQGRVFVIEGATVVLPGLHGGGFMRRVSGLLAVLALAVTTVSAQAPGTGLRGFGTAIIDGVLSPGEWDNAGQVSFPVNGLTTPATFFAMNDANNLYLALRVQPAGSQVGDLSSFSVQFDNDHDGRRGEGDDSFVLNPSGQLLDNFRTLLPPCPPGGACDLFDTSFGGTNDGIGQVSTAGGFTTYETSRPLDSADDAHDFSLIAGDTVGWSLFLRLLSPWPRAFIRSHSPSMTAEMGRTPIRSRSPLIRLLSRKPAQIK
jgi:hypothetical protein